MCLKNHFLPGCTLSGNPEQRTITQKKADYQKQQSMERNTLDILLAHTQTTMFVSVDGKPRNETKKNILANMTTQFIFKSLAASTISLCLATHGRATITTTHANNGFRLNQVVTLDAMEQHD